MKILVVNAGSSSLKYQLIDMSNEKCICSGGVDRVGGKSKLEHNLGNKKIFLETDVPNHTEALALVLGTIVDKEYGGIASIHEIGAVGHRVLHAGESFTGSVLITDEVIETLESLIPLGPLHMPANINCIKSCKAVLQNVPMVAVFDTSFHMTMPKKAFMYAIDYQDYEEYKVRKYGFHGTSHKFVAQEAVKYLGIPNSKIITCHLGNGSSASAIFDGKCVDTTMGLTPLEGLMMGTRSGDIDPACLQFLMGKKNWNIDRMITYLNNECGLKGIAGVSDSRDVVAKAEMGDERALLARDMLAYRVKKYIGAYAAALGGVDCIVFTGGIGENSKEMRELIMEDMSYLGVDFDFEKNNDIPRIGTVELNTPTSKVKVLRIKTNEELVIARETKFLTE